MSNLDMDDFLEHYGVKGMHWGVRKEDVGSNSKKHHVKNQTLTHEEKAVLSKLGLSENDANSMKSKYGPPVKTEKKQSRFHLTKKQKVLIATGAEYAFVGLALYGLYKSAKPKTLDQQFGISRSSKNMKAFFTKSNATKVRLQDGFTKEDVAKLSDTPISFKPGAIVKRVSMTKEVSARSDGFYAAFKDEDITRYKAALPCYWKYWGHKKGTGHVVSLKAVKEVTAPSEKETLRLFQEILDKPYLNSGSPLRAHLRKLLPTEEQTKTFTDEEFVHRVFPLSAVKWVNTEDPVTRTFFSHLKSKGYNAVVDLNDAGTLAETPMRIIDGTAFEVSGSERLSKLDIAEARRKVLDVVHSILSFFYDAYDRKLTF